ncbi:hypothetical protein D3C81_1740030 [compost metagenome]
MIARKLEPERNISSLDEWLEVYDIPRLRRHHALEDSKMTAGLWTAIITHLKEQGVITLGDLYSYLSKN